VPEQLVTPAASNAYRPESPSPTTYTSPSATVGDESPNEPLVALQSGKHVFGVPEQLVTPVASKASRPPPYGLTDPMYTTPPTTAGEEKRTVFPEAVPVHSGVQTLGIPEQ